MKSRSLGKTLGLSSLAALTVVCFLEARADGGLLVGEVETFLELPVGDHPEGIAFDREGNLYFGNRLEVPGGLVSQLRKITPEGSDIVIATFGTSPANALLGLATDGDGNVWAAVHGGADHGVWRISGNGKTKVRIGGSEQMDFPNALTFDARGNLYVTDSGPVIPPVGGTIWRRSKGASSFEIWSEDEVLAPLPFDPFGGPLPGANGIAYFPPDSLYVANTEKGQIFRIPILPDGSPGAAEAVTPFFSVPTADGIAVDVHGDIHVALPGHALLPLFGIEARPLVHVEASTGAIEPTTLPEFDGAFDFPLSLAFDTLPGESTNLYVSNGDLPGFPGVGPGPRLLRANVGVKGFPGS